MLLHARRLTVAARLAALLLVAPLGGCYYLHVTAGQLDLNARRVPIGEVLADPGTPPGLRARLGTRHFGRISAGIYRFRPDGSTLEQVAAGACNTWGCEVAPDGEIFFSTATCGEPILHVVLPEKTVGRAALHGVRAAVPIIEENRVYPARTETRQPYLQIDWVGAWTAASGACKKAPHGGGSGVGPLPTFSGGAEGLAAFGDALLEAARRDERLKVHDLLAPTIMTHAELVSRSRSWG